MTQVTKMKTRQKIYKNGFIFFSFFLKKSPKSLQSTQSSTQKKSSDSQMSDAPVSSINKTIPFCFCYWLVRPWLSPGTDQPVAGWSVWCHTPILRLDQLHKFRLFLEPAGKTAALTGRGPALV